MKVYHSVGLDIHDGKADQAWEWAIKITKYLNEHFPETKVELLHQIGGQTNRVGWLVRHESLAALEAYHEKAEADAGCQQLTAEALAQGFFIGSSHKEGIFRIRS